MKNVAYYPLYYIMFKCTYMVKKRVNQKIPISYEMFWRNEQIVEMVIDTRTVTFSMNQNVINEMV